MSNIKLLQRLREECDTMRSRAQAILDCPDAIEHLVAYDVFGGRFRDLLKTDCSKLAEAIDMVDNELEKS